MKDFFFLVLGLIFIFGSIFLFLKQPYHGENQRRILKIDETSIEVEVADTAETRMQGLSDREVLPEGTGMFFVFEKPAPYGFIFSSAGSNKFWMKGMNFAIDIVWVNESFEVVGIENDISPETFPKIFYPNIAIKYVLEVPSGFSRNHGIDIGDIMYFE